MNIQTKLATCCLLVLAMTAMPIANAGMAPDHGKNPLNYMLYDSAGPDSTGCGWYDPAGFNTDGTAICPTDNPNGVSGNYLNVGQNTFTVSNVAPLTALVGGVGVTIFPFGYVGAFGSMLCDIEVGGAGQDPNSSITDDYLDESDVDGSAGGSQGIVPEGTWDDGGDSAACHVRSYDHGDDTGPNQEPSDAINFNTEGCPGVAFAEDIVSAERVWLATTCDDSGVISNDEGDFFGCAANTLLQGANPGRLQACALEFVAGMLTPTSVPDIITCGYDGSRDNVNYGAGDGDKHVGSVGVPYPAYSFPTTGSQCTASDAVAAAFVMHRIEVNAFYGFNVGVAAGQGCDIPSPCIGTVDVSNTELIPYVAGWIDWNGTAASSAWAEPDGTTNGNEVHVLPDNTIADQIPDSCSDGIDNDLDLDADAADPDDCQNGDTTEDTSNTPPTCANLFDDDGDGFTDADDSDCHTDGDATDFDVPATYDPTLAE